MSHSHFVGSIDNVSISARDIEQYLRDSFAVLRKVIASDTVSALRSAYDQVLASTTGTADCILMGGTNPHVNRPLRLHEIFRANEAIEEGKKCAAVLMGDPRTQLTWDMLIYKAPGSMGVSDWHQERVDPPSSCGYR
jgi:hypothetical protein